jgi:hypothetical protein
MSEAVQSLRRERSRRFFRFAQAAIVLPGQISVSRLGFRPRAMTTRKRNAPPAQEFPPRLGRRLRLGENAPAAAGPTPRSTTPGRARPKLRSQPRRPRRADASVGTRGSWPAPMLKRPLGGRFNQRTQGLQCSEAAGSSAFMPVGVRPPARHGAQSRALARAAGDKSARLAPRRFPTARGLPGLSSGARDSSS